VDWGKVDAPLASALAGASPDEPLSVFVQIDASRGDVDGDALDRLGLGRDAADVSTATLSPAQLDALTDQDWVRYVRLSGRLRLLRPPEAPLAPAGEKRAGAGDEHRRAKQEKRKPRPS
jgi:hypothetical protein